MSHSDIHGVIVLVRNGDRYEHYQDSVTYKASYAASTPLGAVQSHGLGAYLRSLYFHDTSPRIQDVNAELVDLAKIHVLVNSGEESTSVFNSATALLQGLFPPSVKHRTTLANDSSIVAPLKGYQYIPVETAEPANDRSLESWTDCPAFQQHVKNVLSSTKFKEAKREAESFYKAVESYIPVRPVNLDNAYNVFDYMSSQFIHNQTFAYSLPPTFMQQARGWADFRENAVFSDEQITGIGYIASRTTLSTITTALQRIAFNGDPLRFMLIESTYHPFISLFHQTEMIKSHPELQAIPNFASALAIELRRSPSDARDFLSFKFRNGSEEDFRPVHIFGHREDIPLTEFIYRVGKSVINSNSEWSRACGVSFKAPAPPGYLGLGSTSSDAAFDAAGVFILILLIRPIWLFCRGFFHGHETHDVGEKRLVNA